MALAQVMHQALAQTMEKVMDIMMVMVLPTSQVMAQAMHQALALALQQAQVQAHQSLAQALAQAQVLEIAQAMVIGRRKRGKMMETGVYNNLSFEEYLAVDAVSNSYLSRLNIVPAAAKLEREETSTLLVGRVIHSILLTPSDFERDYAITPECDKRTKKGKEAFEAFQSANAGKGIITADDLATLEAIKTAIWAHPFASELLQKGSSEISCVWNDETTGIKCKARPDRIPDGNKGVLVDIKSCRSADKGTFTKAVLQYGYARQAAFYCEGIFQAGGLLYDYFVWIAVEKEPPYRVEVYVADDHVLQYGFDSFHQLLDLEKKCRISGYPHYKEAGAQTIHLPEWAYGG